MENKPKKMNIRGWLFIFLFVFTILVAGVTVSYAYYTLNIRGQASTEENTSGVLNVTTSLTNSAAINTSNLVLIAGDDLSKAQKVEFTITNESDSTVAALYTIKLVDVSLTQNLYSKYLKWAIVIDGDKTNMITGDFHDETGAILEGTTDKTPVSMDSKILISDDNAKMLDVGKTVTVDFYLWLENDDTVNQIYLTSGNFSGKLSLNATPYRKK